MKEKIGSALLVLVTACAAPLVSDTQEVTVEPITMDLLGIQAAVDSLPPAGGRVFLAAGEYNLTHQNARLEWRDDAMLECEDGAVLRKAQHASGSGWSNMILVEGLTNVTFLNCDFFMDYDPPSCTYPDPNCPNFISTILAKDAQRVEIRRNRFRLRPSNVGYTQIAIYTGGSDDVLIQNNTVDGMMLQVGGGGNVTNVSSNLQVFQNLIKRPYNHGITVTALEEGEQDYSFENVYVEDNIIVDVPSVGAIHLGVDGDIKTLTSFENLHVRGNTIMGAWSSAAGFGISFKAPVTANRIHITDNMITNDGALAQNAYGIIYKTQDDRVSSQVRIQDNTIGEGLGKQGVYLVAKGRDFVVSGNSISGARGIRVTSETDSYWVEVHHNRIRSFSDALIVDGAGHNWTDIGFNKIETTGAWKSAVERTLTVQDNVTFHNNTLFATGNGSEYWDGVGGTCVNNAPEDC